MAKPPTYRMLPIEAAAALRDAYAVRDALANLRKQVRSMCRALKRIHGTGVAAAKACGMSAVYFSWINTGRTVPSVKILLSMVEEIERCSK